MSIDRLIASFAAALWMSRRPTKPVLQDAWQSMQVQENAAAK